MPLTEAMKYGRARLPCAAIVAYAFAMSKTRTESVPKTFDGEVDSGIFLPPSYPCTPAALAAAALDFGVAARLS
uniref:hypothetical protein n=1 Tax=Salinibacter ruber TaxID=146919 RepID=UPI002072FA19